MENQQNLSCEFTEEIISYLYDELNSTDKLRFESHLVNCGFCPAEISSFGVVRASIIEWKKVEFDVLSTPIIEIPALQPARQIVSVSRPWYAKIRDLFSLSPAWMTATTAVAVVVICVGLGFVLISSLRNTTDFAQENNKVKPVPSPTTEIKPVDTTSSSNSSQSNPNLTKSPTSSSSNVDSPKPTTAPAPVKITERQIVKPQNSNVKKNVAPTVDKSNKVTNKSPRKARNPSLVGDEDEEDSLRLSDIFDEIGTR